MKQDGELLAERLAKFSLFAGHVFGSTMVTSNLGVTRTALSLAIQRLVGRGEIAHPGRSRFVIRGIVWAGWLSAFFDFVNALTDKTR